METSDRWMRAKCMMRDCLRYMETGKADEGKKDKGDPNEPSEGAEKAPKKKARNNPFAIANAAKKKFGMSAKKTEDMTMDLKKKGFDNY